ncbi:MAG TPA: cell division protein FtsB [Gammaproteobacteria bacterium]|nr:cell division protein FtsB [Gammaproteobacteria bacterium]
MKPTALVLVLLLALLALLQYKLWFSPDGIAQYWKLKHEIAKNNQENAQMQDRNSHMAAEVKDLKQGDEAIEERARDDLGLVKPGEVFYQIVN